MYAAVDVMWVDVNALACEHLVFQGIGFMVWWRWRSHDHVAATESVSE